jgi:hypothetical protein
MIQWTHLTRTSFKRVGDIAGELRTAQESLREADAAAQAARAAEADAATTAARLERKVGLLTKERDGLKRILASYDEDEAAGSGPWPPLPPVFVAMTKCWLPPFACLVMPECSLLPKRPAS